jgi:2-hydroxy-3-keto-5-methylthiopentenyl-1-phosphate phosphatase
MANFDHIVDETETQLSIKVATFAFGNVNLILNKTLLSQQEADQLTSQLTEQDVAEEQIIEFISQEAAARQTQSEICQSIQINGIDEVVNIMGTDPSGWYVSYCNTHNIILT